LLLIHLVRTMQRPYFIWADYRCIIEEAKTKKEELNQKKAKINQTLLDLGVDYSHSNQELLQASMKERARVSCILNERIRHLQGAALVVSKARNHQTQIG
jgi:hypothetical protein